jgi:hypothetical protein
VLATLFCCAVLALVAAKLRQDQNHAKAWAGLQQIGMTSSIRSLPGHRVTELVFTKSDFNEKDIDLLLSHIEALGHRRDLGLTRGEEIILVDLRKSRLSESAIAKLRAALPNAEIRH